MSRMLPPDQAAVLNALEPGQSELVPDLAARLGVDQAQVSAAAVPLEEAGWIEVRVDEIEEWSVDASLGGLDAFRAPRSIIHEALQAHDGRGSIQQIAEWTGLESKVVGQAIRPLTSAGWVTKEGPELVAKEVAGGAVAVEETVVHALASGPLRVSVLVERGLDTEGAREHLQTSLPKGAFQTKIRKNRWLTLTASGEAMRAEGVDAVREVSQVTPDLLASGDWENVRFKPYDIHLDTEPQFIGKKHPLQLVIERTRNAFLEMGFEEAASSYVESGFWTFDALFQPQDHPAREMQDTFYMKEPGETPLPSDEEMVERVRATHETGGDTGSVGWRYRWDKKKAMQNVLRTHTTATTIRELAKNPKGPRKVFSIGRVFRRETIDYKHLPIFFQVDGIIVDKEANLSSLMGTLAAFYEAMGFEKFYFRPGFFPYTEPSVEVFIWHEEKQDWFEMGGSGIFRPEVTEPLGCTEPVLAWGLGLDRLAMLLHDRGDIRDLYMADLEWLRKEPRCR